MEFVGSAGREQERREEGENEGKNSRRRVIIEDAKEYKSKNLKAERKRRQKISDRLLALRAAVPKITNMNRMTIIDDAIAYIQELERSVRILTDALQELEPFSEEEHEPNLVTSDHRADIAEEMRQCGIMEEVQVTEIDVNKLWVKFIMQKNRGWFGRYVEAMTYFGFEITDMTVTTYKAAVLVSSSIEASYGYVVSTSQAKELLLEIIKII